MKWMWKWIRKGLKALTFKISKAVTYVVLILGALVNIREPKRLGIAALIFTGLPIGLIIFGPQVFSISIWLAIIVITIFRNTRPKRY